MRYIKGFWMALGMFCGIPLPLPVWDEKLMPVMVAALPPVGAIIGAIWWAAGLLLVTLNPPLMLGAAILTVVPFFAAGFIHLDGYMDTSDALLSRRPMQDRLRILKDPRVGAFAVVMLAILFLLKFGAMYSVAESGRYLALLIVICVISRSGSALSILVLRHMPESGYASMLAGKAGVGHKIFVVTFGMGAIMLAALYAGLAGLIVSGAVIVGYALAMRVAYKSMGGVSGDLLGYALVISELCGLIALALL
ncbi:MAG: adenosylcobinamide-GDP ribazoletransferase [Clostridiales bacterium]|jgi:adenosylcobinamide-GDP ribazoletransferase|nr:adenosylcobinamide-GDP ribazoletransferase [Clostridiales bacterium]